MAKTPTGTKARTKKKAEAPEETPEAQTTGYIQQLGEVTLRTSSQYLFVSDRGMQLSDGIVLELGIKNCETVTVIKTDTKHVTEVVKELDHDGAKITIGADDFGESKTLLFTANATTPEGFAISFGASVYKVVLEANSITIPGTELEEDMAAQAALVDDFFSAMNKEKATDDFSDIDDCLDCEIIPENIATEIRSPVAEAQLLDWEEITDEVSRVYYWPERELQINNPRALFYKKDHHGVTTVILDAQGVSFEIPRSYLFLVRHPRR